MNKELLIKLLEELKEIRTKTRTKVGDEVLFDCAVRIHNSEQIESHRQGKSFSVKLERPPFHSPAIPNEPASKEQIDLLKKLGYKGTLDLSKREAWRKTKELKER